MRDVGGVKKRAPDQPSTRTSRAVIPSRYRRQHRLLLDLRDHLSRDEREILRDTARVPGVDDLEATDCATDEFDRALSLALVSSESDVLFEIEEALRRFEAGTYGVCEVTGKRIPVARLRAIPWTRFTTEAAGALERKGSQARTHLGKTA